MNDELRAEFPVLANWIFLNHASVAPLSRRAQARLDAWTHDATVNGNIHEAEWMKEIERRRLHAARLLGAKSSEIAFLKNTSEGLSLIAEGFPWKAGDNVVLIEGEYPANVYPWMNLGDRGVETRFIKQRDGRIPYEEIAAGIDAKTRLLSLSFVQFASGYRADLERIGALCRQREIDFCVDAIQGLGVLPLDVEAMNIDYLSADGHKWLLGPMGASILYIRAEKLERIRPISIGWKSVINENEFSTIDFRLKPAAARHEEGSPNVAGILALGANLEWFLELGGGLIQDRLRAITELAIDKLRSHGAAIFSPRGDKEWSGIVSFSLPKVDPKEAVVRLRSEKIVLGARAGRLRISPHFYNNEEDMDGLMDALGRLG